MTYPKICIYTAIYNDYENLRDHIKLNQECDFICFTDNPSLTSSTWDVRYLKPDIEPLMFYKRLKCLSHEYLKEYDFTIWLDANFKITASTYIEQMLSQLKSDSILLYKHFCLCGIFRDCLYKEAIFSRSNKKYNIMSMNQQIDTYKRLEQYPASNGLYQSGFLLRNHNGHNVIEFNKTWFNEIMKYGHAQCQVSLPFALWKTKVKFDVIKTPIWDSNIYSIYDHKHSKVIYDNCIISKLKTSSLCDIILYDSDSNIENIQKLSEKFTSKMYVLSDFKLNINSPDIQVIKTTENIVEQLNSIVAASTNKYVMILKNSNSLPVDDILNGYLTVFYHTESKYILIGLKNCHDLDNIKNIVGIIAYRESVFNNKFNDKIKYLKSFDEYVTTLISRHEKLAFYKNSL